MKPVQPALSVKLDKAPIVVPAASCFLESREAVNLNSLIARAVKHAGNHCGGILLRMDELPQISAYTQPLLNAFDLLLRFVLEHRGACSKVYCNVQGKPSGTSLLDEQGSPGAYLIAIHTNVQQANGETGSPMLQEATRLFAQNKIGLVHKNIAAGGMLFSLTLYGGAQPTDSGPC